MNKNYLSFGLALSLGLQVSSTYPMAGMAKYLSKEYLRKGIEKCTTGLHWGIAAGPFWASGAFTLLSLEKLKKNIIEANSANTKESIHKVNGKFYTAKEYDERIKKQEEWIRQELKSLGYSNWKTVDVIPFSHFQAFGNFKSKTLFYDGDLAAQAFDENHLKSNKYLEMRGALSHEIGHLKNHDSEKALILGFTIPFITHMLSKKITALVQLPITNFGLRNGLKIITGIPKLAMNYLPLWTYWYFAEKKADEEVINDVEVLETSAQSMRNYERDIYSNQLTQLKKIIDTHPHPLKRAQRFEERVAQLRK